MKFADRILQWYSQNKRDLPWRGSTDPYRIWLSEILMQQTRIEQGTPYYLKFLEVFPTVHHLANAPEEQVMKLWQGLGYYNRARNLHATAQLVSRELKGVFPNTFEGLLELKGVGPYTASAIASICYNEKRGVVDGNVYRVLSRYFGIATPIDRPEGQKEFQQLAQDLLPEDHLGDYNQGMMEFGAVQCRPKKPHCGTCPLQEDCLAFRQNRTGNFPVKQGKTKVKKEYLHYGLKWGDDGLLVSRQRSVNGYWPKLFEFPGVQLTEANSLEQAEKMLRSEMKLEEKEELRLINTTSVKHQLSHRSLELYFWSTEEVRTSGREQRLLAVQKMDELAWPVPLADFLQRMNF
jgi:A/G-specific adenine glycosylase